MSHRLRPRLAQIPVPQINRTRPTISGPRLAKTQLWDLFEEVVASKGRKLRSHHKPNKERSREVTRLFKRLENPTQEHQAPQSRVLIEACRCLRCDRIWVTLIPPPFLPRQCPGCSSFRWFYPEEYSKEFWKGWKTRRKELHAKEDAWMEQLSRAGLQELRDLALASAAHQGRQAAKLERARKRRWKKWVGEQGPRRERVDRGLEGVAPELGCRCVPGHLEGGPEEHPACDLEGCPCRRGVSSESE